MKNKIQDLRDHLFETLEALKDKENPMPIERAAAIADVAQVIVNSAKVEVDALKLTDGVGASEFIPSLREIGVVPRGPKRLLSLDKK